MNQEIKKEWLEDLRSGKFKQGRSRLKDSEDVMCCLGVLCDLHRRKTGNGDWSRGASGYRYKPSDAQSGQLYFLPQEVAE